VPLVGAGLGVKPGAPVALTAKLVAVDSISGTAWIEVVAQPSIKAATVHLACDLPDGSAIVPGSGEWATGRLGRKTMTLRVTLPPRGGKLIVRAELKGKNIHTGAVTGLALPPAKPDGVKTAPKKPPRVIKTSRGERLRLHK